MYCRIFHQRLNSDEVGYEGEYQEKKTPGYKNHTFLISKRFQPISPRGTVQYMIFVFCSKGDGTYLPTNAAESLFRLF
jgi:hypothetical protein